MLIKKITKPKDSQCTKWKKLKQKSGNTIYLFLIRYL